MRVAWAFVSRGEGGFSPAGSGLPVARASDGAARASTAARARARAITSAWRPAGLAFLTRRWGCGGREDSAGPHGPATGARPAARGGAEAGSAGLCGAGQGRERKDQSLLPRKFSGVTRTTAIACERILSTPDSTNRARIARFAP